MSSKNFEFFERYDKAMIADTIVTSTRHHQLVDSVGFVMNFDVLMLQSRWQ
ncbi:MAG: hypothetical protein OEW49_04660 [Nitrosopumilus sp.]|nr:hypothetical protein [Nitrosopumilus sp.]